MKALLLRLIALSAAWIYQMCALLVQKDVGTEKMKFSRMKILSLASSLKSIMLKTLQLSKGQRKLQHPKNQRLTFKIKIQLLFRASNNNNNPQQVRNKINHGIQVPNMKQNRTIISLNKVQQRRKINLSRGLLNSGRAHPRMTQSWEWSKTVTEVIKGQHLINNYNKAVVVDVTGVVAEAGSKWMKLETLIKMRDLMLIQWVTKLRKTRKYWERIPLQRSLRLQVWQPSLTMILLLTRRKIMLVTVSSIPSQSQDPSLVDEVDEECAIV